MWLLFLTIGLVNADLTAVNTITNVTKEISNNVKLDPDINEASNSHEEEGTSDVETEFGPVRGFKRESGVWEYFDIPYGTFDADNPFQEPVESKPWSTIREITEHRSHCPQILPNTDTLSGTQDCLTLSIFTPDNKEKNNGVLFHIHDGSFTSGSGDPGIYGPDYLVPKGIILVLPNYRLGPLGFLCLQNETIPGNAGLKDLTLALHWTKINIKAFGGNPSNIVVSGSGSGAALAEYLMISERSKQYISRGITESGFVLSNWAIDRQPLETAAILDENIRKGQESSKGTRIFKQLNEVSEFIEVIAEVVKASKGISFKPCIENNINGFLTKSPWSILESIETNIDYMIGTANFAGLQKASDADKESLAQFNKDYSLLLPNDLIFDEDLTKEEIGKRVKTQYFNEDDISMDNLDKLVQCYTDSEYLSPAIRGARLLVNGGATIYFYEFAFAAAGDNLDRSELGDSIKYVFSQEKIFVENTKKYQMKKLMTSLWISFINTGKPASEGVEWVKLEKVEDKEEKWLSIGSKTDLQEGLHLDRLRLWDEIYEKYFIDRNTSENIKSSITTIVISLMIVASCRKKLTH